MSRPEKVFIECEECSGEFSVESSMYMKFEFCVFCGEPLDDIDWEVPKDYAEEEDVYSHP
jgi:hypothetical protein